MPEYSKNECQIVVLPSLSVFQRCRSLPLNTGSTSDSRSVLISGVLSLSAGSLQKFLLLPNWGPLSMFWLIDNR